MQKAFADRFNEHRGTQLRQRIDISETGGRRRANSSDTMPGTCHGTAPISTSCQTALNLTDLVLSLKLSICVAGLKVKRPSDVLRLVSIFHSVPAGSRKRYVPLIELCSVSQACLSTRRQCVVVSHDTLRMLQSYFIVVIITMSATRPKRRWIGRTSVNGMPPWMTGCCRRRSDSADLTGPRRGRAAGQIFGVRKLQCEFESPQQA